MLKTPLLIVITERGKHEEIAKAAVKAGAKMIQLRDKEASEREFFETAKKLKKICKNKAKLIINDRIEIATKVGDGLHLGCEDLKKTKWNKLRKKLGKKIIGLSARNYWEAIEVAKLNPDYIGFGPIFPTISKKDASAPVGIRELRKTKRAFEKRKIKIPLIAIGGINKSNAKEVIKAGADGIAVISAISMEEDKIEATKELLKLLKS